jgi:hypothetical protein
MLLFEPNNTSKANRPIKTMENLTCQIDGCVDKKGKSTVLRAADVPEPDPILAFLCKKHAPYVRKELREALTREGPATTLRLIALRRRTSAEVVYRLHGAKEAQPYVDDSEKWRRSSVLYGHGDPLSLFSKTPLPADARKRLDDEDVKPERSST